MPTDPATVPSTQAHPTPSTRVGRTAILIAVVAAGSCGVLASALSRQFIVYQRRSPQAECKTLLKSLISAQKLAYADKARCGADFGTVGLAPERATRYSYFMGSGAEIPASHPLKAAAQASDVPPLAGGLAPGVYGTCPDDCFVVAACVGNIDTDATLDVWSISTKAREKAGLGIPAGVPFNEVNDLED